MSNNLDDFLNSLGIETTVPANDEAVETLDNIVVAADITQQEPVASENNPQNLSNDDFDDILGEYGFSRTQDAEAEEVTEEEEREEEEEVNTDIFEENAGEAGVAAQEYRDFGAEEDAEWLERIASVDIEEAANTANLFNPATSIIEASITSVNLQNLEPDAVVPYDAPLLPQNSPTLLMDDSTTRFSGAEWFNEIQRKTIIIAGQGGIGRMKNFL